MAANIAVRRVALLSLHSSPIAPLGRSDAGGMNLYVRRLASDLTTRGIAVDVFTRRTDGVTPEIMQLTGGGRIIHLSAGPSRRLPKTVLPLHLPAMVSALRAFVAREQIEYDIIHSHYWLSGLAALRYRLNTLRPAPFVHMFHTLAKVKEFYQGEPDRDDSALRFDGERCLISRADSVVGATEGERREMTLLYGRAPADYEVIPPGVDLGHFSPRSRSCSRDRLGIDADRVILFVGRQDRLKGLETLLDSVAKLPAGLREGSRVVLVGGQDSRRSGEAQRQKRLIERLGLQNLVEVRGKVDQTELPWYYSAADVCAVPSAYESFGMVALEAMACQTPPVAFNVGGLATTIADGRTGFLAQPGNRVEYAAKLATALASSELETMGRRARMSAQRYTWELTASRTVELYERLACTYRRDVERESIAQ